MAHTPSFDWESFWDSVEEYRARHHLHILDIAEMGDVAISYGTGTFRYNYKYRRPLGLEVLLRIAQVCDIDLNKYNKAKVYV